MEHFYNWCKQSYLAEVELIGKKYRIPIGFIDGIVFTLSSSLVGLVAYYIRDWRTLQLVLGIPMFAIPIITWYTFPIRLHLGNCVIHIYDLRFLPESIRWLITQKRYSEARMLILRAAKINNKHVPEHLLVIPGNCNEFDDKPSENIMFTIRSPVMCKRLVILCIGW